MNTLPMPPMQGAEKRTSAIAILGAVLGLAIVALVPASNLLLYVGVALITSSTITCLKAWARQRR
ncbi:hypothetical protein GB931_19380 [Modestobacter sp. I12A-02628]|uniref:Uncharacterized protein n=1 Tax=Goekera deserti TaxID=2497753 RepID=A0A7K3WI55_9ACTN|nr:hypothetical protein [Goekera deserti]MPR00042.1 hypothetical protein [Goekera deserti]NDI49821.1 hypothetical protein [Goekera deserti]NEL55183.1 hypothetical protein [Goekera deserti]